MIADKTGSQPWTAVSPFFGLGLALCSEDT